MVFIYIIILSFMILLILNHNFFYLEVQIYNFIKFFELYPTLPLPDLFDDILPWKFMIFYWEEFLDRLKNNEELPEEYQYKNKNELPLPHCIITVNKHAFGFIDNYVWMFKFEDIQLSGPKELCLICNDEEIYGINEKINEVKKEVEEINKKVGEIIKKDSKINKKVDGINKEVKEINMKLEEINKKINKKLEETSKKDSEINMKIEEIDKGIDEKDEETKNKIEEIKKKVEEIKNKFEEINKKIDFKHFNIYLLNSKVYMQAIKELIFVNETENMNIIDIKLDKNKNVIEKNGKTIEENENVKTIKENENMKTISKISKSIIEDKKQKSSYHYYVLLFNDKSYQWKVRDFYGSIILQVYKIIDSENFFDEFTSSVFVDFGSSKENKIIHGFNLFNNNDIVLLTTKGVLIYHFN